MWSHTCHHSGKEEMVKACNVHPHIHTEILNHPYFCWQNFYVSGSPNSDKRHATSNNKWACCSCSCKLSEFICIFIHPVGEYTMLVKFATKTALRKFRSFSTDYTGYNLESGNDFSATSNLANKTQSNNSDVKNYPVIITKFLSSCSLLGLFKYRCIFGTTKW